jgi:hypothetical protein
MIATNGLGFSIAASLGQSKWAFIRSKQEIMLEMERFDDASRGIFGSSKLLGRSLKHFKSGLFCLSAPATITTLLMVAFGPFVQQAVEISLREKIGTNTATIGRSLSYPRVTRSSNTPDYVPGYEFIGKRFYEVSRNHYVDSEFSRPLSGWSHYCWYCQ